MSYEIFIKQQARKMLQSLSRSDKYRMTEKIMLLGRNPEDPGLDVKRLQGVSFYRLRVGSWRIIYDKDDEIRIITIEKIKSRGDVYK